MLALCQPPLPSPVYPPLGLDGVIQRGGQLYHMPHPLQVAAETKVCFAFPRGGIFAVCLEIGPGDGAVGGG